MKHLELVEIGAKWLKKHQQNILVPNCSVIATETKSMNKSGEIPDIIGWGHGKSVMIEVKVSRSDFLKNKNKDYRFCGEYKYYLMPKGIFKKSDFTIFSDFGLLEYNEGKIEIIKNAPTNLNPNLDTERAILLKLLRNK